MTQSDRQTRYNERIIRENIQLYEEKTKIVKMTESVVKSYEDRLYGYRILIVCLLLMYLVIFNLFVELLNVQHQHPQFLLESHKFQQLYPLLDYVNVSA